ncbi:MAG: ABC transporter ATP-binding protein [Candidatus Latescibacteria bacterium]|nr:ABC transporter ATP-binding protein [Candidatus Latescibacterota bacterium]
MLELTNISKSFRGPEGEVRALEGIDLTVSPGQFTVVSGSSGSGKTTLLLAAGGLLRPDAGQVLVGGQDPYKMRPDQRAAFRAQAIGFVFQQFHLVPYLSVLENVRVAATACGHAVASRQTGDEDRARQLLRRFDLGPRMDHVPAQLSTGERQRTALARAMLNEPGLVLADEPTGNLDAENGGIVLSCLSEFARGDGAVLVVTHDARAREFADHFVTLRGGRIAPD